MSRLEIPRFLYKRIVVVTVVACSREVAFFEMWDRDTDDTAGLVWFGLVVEVVDGTGLARNEYQRASSQSIVCLRHWRCRELFNCSSLPEYGPRREIITTPYYLEHRDDMVGQGGI